MLADLSTMEASRPEGIPQGIVVPTTIDWRPWNEALNMVNLVADKDIAEAALALDEQIWRAHIVVRRGLTPDEHWLTLRSRIITAQGGFITASRRRFSLTGEPLPRLSGKPAPDDPVWTQ